MVTLCLRFPLWRSPICLERLLCDTPWPLDSVCFCVCMNPWQDRCDQWHLPTEKVNRLEFSLESQPSPQPSSPYPPLPCTVLPEVSGHRGKLLQPSLFLWLGFPDSQPSPASCLGTHQRSQMSLRRFWFHTGLEMTPRAALCLCISLPYFQDKWFTLFPQGHHGCPVTLLLQWPWLSRLDQPASLDFLSRAYRDTWYLGSCASSRQAFNCNGNGTVVINTSEAWVVGTF